MNGRWPNFKYDYAFGAVVTLYEKQFPCLFIIHPREYIEGGEQPVVRLVTAVLRKNRKRKRESEREEKKERCVQTNLGHPHFWTGIIVGGHHIEWKRHA